MKILIVNVKTTYLSKTSVLLFQVSINAAYLNLPNLLIKSIVKLDVPKQ